jgi:hypothetical protein
VRAREPTWSPIKREAPSMDADTRGFFATPAIGAEFTGSLDIGDFVTF